MKKIKPLLSIVVPTKDRYDCLKSLIRLIHSFNSNEIELVIQDNTDDNKPILDFLKDYPEIIYNHTLGQIPISLNSDYAVNNSNGKYVCFIGDDDGVTNYILDCVHFMDNNNIDVVVPALFSYYWPNYISSITGNISGTISYKSYSFKAHEVNIDKVLKKIMDNGFKNRGNLPLLYHGIVKKNVLDSIYEITGTYFPGQSPDIANAVALCFTSSKYFFIDAPIIITGASSTHGGGIRKMKKGYAEIEDVPFLSKDAKSKWEEKIPKVWCGPTIWCESAVKALKYMKQEKLISNVNFEYLYAEIASSNFRLFKLSITYSKNKLVFCIRFCYLFCIRVFNAFLRRILRKIGFEYPLSLKRIHGVENIEQANKYIICKFHFRPFSLRE